MPNGRGRYNTGMAPQPQAEPAEDPNRRLFNQVRYLLRNGLPKEEVNTWLRENSQYSTVEQMNRATSRREEIGSPGMVRGIAGSALQGATLEFGDELLGLTGLVPGGLSRQEMTELIRGEQEAFREEHPVISGLSTVAGAMLVPGSAAAKVASTAPKIATRAAVGAGLGTVEGLIAGYGMGEGGVEKDPSGEGFDFSGLIDRGRDVTLPTVLGGAMGAVTGGAAPAIGRGIESVSGAVGRRIPSGLQEMSAEATKRLQNLVPGGKRGAREIGEQLEVMPTAQPTGVPMDVPQLQGPARHAGAESVDAMQQIKAPLRARAQQHSERLRGAVAENMGIDAPQGSIAQRMAAQAEDTRKLGKDMYGEVSEAFPDLLEADMHAITPLLERAGPNIKAQAESMARIEGRAFNPDAPTFEDLHYVYLAVKDAADEALSGTGARPRRGVRLRELAGEIDETLMNLVPEDYAAAKAAYHLAKKTERAMEAGDIFWRKGSDMRDVDEFLRGADAAEIQAFRTSAGDRLMMELENVGIDQNPLKTVLKETGVSEKKLRTLFDSDEAFNRFRREMDIVQAERLSLDVMSGSQTGSIQALGRQAVGETPGAFEGGVQGVLQRQFSEPLQRQIAKLNLGGRSTFPSELAEFSVGDPRRSAQIMQNLYPSDYNPQNIMNRLAPMGGLLGPRVEEERRR